MTPQKIKELVLENRDLEFSEFIELLKSIDEENEGFFISGQKRLSVCENVEIHLKKKKKFHIILL